MPEFQDENYHYDIWIKLTYFKRAYIMLERYMTLICVGSHFRMSYLSHDDIHNQNNQLYECLLRRWTCDISPRVLQRFDIYMPSSQRALTTKSYVQLFSNISEIRLVFCLNNTCSNFAHISIGNIITP